VGGSNVESSVLASLECGEQGSCTPVETAGGTTPSTRVAGLGAGLSRVDVVETNPMSHKAARPDFRVLGTRKELEFLSVDLHSMISTFFCPVLTVQALPDKAWSLM
jgi:hypothetical protein